MRGLSGDAILRAVKAYAGGQTKRVRWADLRDAGVDVKPVIHIPRALRSGMRSSAAGRDAVRRIEHVPFPLDEVATTSRCWGPSRGIESNDVLLVSTRSENVEQRQAASGRGPGHRQILDVESFALEERLQAHDASRCPSCGIDRTSRGGRLRARAATTFSCAAQSEGGVHARAFRLRRALSSRE